MPETLATPTEFEHIRAELTPLLELDDQGFVDAAQQFIDARISELTGIATHEERLDATDGNAQGFIGPETVIFPEALGKGYKLDDLEVYTTAMPYMRRFYTEFSTDIGDRIKAYRNAALFTAQHVQQAYFGSVHNGADARDKREFLTGDFMDDSAPETRSISEFKGVAMCAERAAVANNILQIFGMQPVLEMGKLQIDDGHDELHAYLVIKDGRGQERIFDPTNPTLIFDGNGSLLATNPAIYLAGDIEDARSSGNPIAGVHRSYEIGEHGREVLDEETYKFSVSTFGKELHPQ